MKEAAFGKAFGLQQEAIGASGVRWDGKKINVTFNIQEGSSECVTGCNYCKINA